MVRTCSLDGYSDVHFTDATVARHIVEHFSPTGRCLEPFRGRDAFYQWLPSGAAWCELADGRDFFAFTDTVDWIITNPPFSCLTKVFEHAFRLADNCVFLIPISKYWSSQPRLQAVASYGGLREILHVGTGRQIGFDIGFPFAAMHFARGYRGAIRQSAVLDESALQNATPAPRTRSRNATPARQNIGRGRIGQSMPLDLGPCQ